MVRVIGASLDPQKQWLFSTQTRIEDKNGGKSKTNKNKKEAKGQKEEEIK